MTAIDPSRHDAVIFDLDGVVTDTASVHEAAWKELFNEFLSARSQSYEPFTSDDYRRYVDGKPRYDGVADFLASRGISLPSGDPSDPPEAQTVCGLGNRKNDAFLARLEREGVRSYPSTVSLLRELRGCDIRTAIISASRNCVPVLEAAGVRDLFDAKVDGTDADELGLPGKPDPAVFLEAARQLGVPPDRAVVVEDAIAGVKAGRRGGFALVVGVDRAGHPEELRDGGADVVVADLSEVAVLRPIGELPGALESIDEIVRGSVAVFLDYDGTLTPIVEDPDQALLPDHTKRAIEELGEVCPVAVVSGRDLLDVREKVGIDGIFYAGSHGFDIMRPDGSRTASEEAERFLPALDAVEEALRSSLDAIRGTRVERKRFAVAVHFRQVPAERHGDVQAAVDRVHASHPDLRKTGGKMIFELRPGIEWDKGKAVGWLLDALGVAHDVVPIYVGDDVTDEDAFRELRGRGISIIVRGGDHLTRADYALKDTEAACTLLEQLRERVSN